MDSFIKTTAPLSDDKPIADTLTGAPNVDLLNSVVPQQTVSSSIGVRKIQPKKSGVSF